jgi:hypothetical protein
VVVQHQIPSGEIDVKISPKPIHVCAGVPTSKINAGAIEIAFTGVLVTFLDSNKRPFAVGMADGHTCKVCATGVVTGFGADAIWIPWRDQGVTYHQTLKRFELDGWNRKRPHYVVDGSDADLGSWEV